MVEVNISADDVTSEWAARNRQCEIAGRAETWVAGRDCSAGN